MGKKRNNKITKRTIPAGFSVSLALVDLIPVVCFGLSAVRVGSLFSSTLFMIGAGICLIFRCREGAVEADCCSISEEYLVHVRANADFDAGGIPCDAGGADC